MSVQSKAKNKLNKNLWEGAFILTLAGLITKLLSAGYRIPYQNIAGDIGFYIYQQVYPIYGIILVLSTSGFPVVISKLVAEKIEQNDNHAVDKIIFVSFIVLVAIGLFGFTIFNLGAEQIAQLMGDSELILLIKVISFSFLILPFVSILRGYFQGKRTMVPTAISQIIEQATRVLTILLFSYILLAQGYGSYIAGAGAIFGSITGGFAAVIVLVFFLFKAGEYRNIKKLRYSFVGSGKIIKVLLAQGFTICVSGLLLILIQLVDSFTLYSQLVLSGHGEMIAKQLKGIYDRGQPLIQLGTIVATSLSLSIVPLISSAKVRNDETFINEKINLSIRVSIVVGLGASLGLMSIIKPTNIMLFKDNLGSMVLLILGVSILFTSISLTMAAILQGLGNAFSSAAIVLIGMAIKWILNLALIPTFSTIGAGVATVVAFMVIAVLHFIVLRRKVSRSFLDYKEILKIVFAAIIMVGTIRIFMTCLAFLFPDIYSTRIFSTFTALSSIMVGGSTFLIVILKVNVFSKDELLLLPFGDRIRMFLK